MAVGNPCERVISPPRPQDTEILKTIISSMFQSAFVVPLSKSVYQLSPSPPHPPSPHPQPHSLSRSKRHLHSYITATVEEPSTREDAQVGSELCNEHTSICQHGPPCVVIGILMAGFLASLLVYVMKTRPPSF